MKKFYRFAINASLMLLSFVISFFFLESYCRLEKFGLSRAFFQIKDFSEERNLHKQSYPIQFDKNLGWSNKPGNYGTENIWNVNLSITPEGFRSNGNHTSNSKNKKNTSVPILAAGDSYTFGDEVGDDQTFPAHLESILTSSKVLNGGVCAFGIDQIYLRAIELINTIPVSKVVFSFIPNDILRAEQDVRHRLNKPYFILDNNKLKLMPITVSEFSVYKKSSFKKIAGYSLLAHRIFLRFFPDYWLNGMPLNNRKIHEDGPEITVRLINSLYKTCQEKNIDLLVVALSENNYSKINQDNISYVLQEVNKDINRLNIFEDLESLIKTNPELHNSYFRGHMTPKGNLYVARKIASKL
ncbi:MAG: hypothetical protein GY730_08050 [bacterium]|nr:hypothetical protein [bacterium]